NVSPPAIVQYRVRACNGPACSGYVYSAWVDVYDETDPDCIIVCPPGGLPTVSTAPPAGAQQVADTPHGTSHSSAPLAKGGRRAAPGGGLLSSVTAPHAAYSPRAAASQDFHLMPPARPADRPAIPRSSRATPIGRASRDERHLPVIPTAFTPLYASAFAPAPFAPRAARSAASRPVLSNVEGGNAGWEYMASLWQEKTSGDGSGYRVIVQYTYDNYGHLTQVANQEQNIVYWQATASDAYGHITAATLGNGLTTHNTFDPATGQLQGSTTGPAGNPAQIQNLAYQWDAVGNLEQRQDLNRSLTETFTYDALNRLTQTRLNSLVTQALSYDALGNIQQKTVTGAATTYVYDLA